MAAWKSFCPPLDQTHRMVLVRPNVTRAVVAAMDATDGRSPHILADLTTVLRERGHTVTVQHVIPERAHLNVDGWPIVVSVAPPHENGPYDLWFYVSLGASHVRCNAARLIRDAPMRYVDLKRRPVDVLGDVAADWSARWPRGPAVSGDGVAAALGSEATVVATSDLLYVSETTLSDAVRLVLHAPEWGFF